MLVGYGDDYGLSHHAVLTSNHVVREASRLLIADEGEVGFRFVCILKVLATFTSNHVVREASRLLIADEGRAALSGCLLGSGQQRRGVLGSCAS